MEFTTPEVHIPSFNLWIPHPETSPVWFGVMLVGIYFLGFFVSARIIKRLGGVSEDIGFGAIVWPFLLIAIIIAAPFFLLYKLATR